MNNQITTIGEYISEFPIEVQEKLLSIRNQIKQIAPDAEESISYGMPAYKLNKRPLVYYGGFKNHIGFYATPMGHKKFEKNSRHTNKEKVQYNSHLTSLCQLN